MTTPPAESPVPFWEDLLEIYYAPRAVFERRKDSGFGLPMLVLLVVFTTMFFAGRSLMQPIFDAEFDRGFALAMKQNPQLTADKAEQSKTVAKSMAAIFIPVYVLIAPLLVGLALWIFGKFFEARQELGAACMVAVYAFFPRLLESLLNLLQLAVLPAEQFTSHYAVQLGPARFLDPDQGSMVLITILGRLDLITLWCTALLAIGLSVTGRISIQKSAIAAGLVWLIAGLWPLWGAIRAGG
jgi:hypothetical protein